MLEFTDKTLGNAEVVAAKGRIDSATSPLLDAHCRDLLRAGCKCVVFDFTELQFLSSEGLRTLLGLAKRIHAGGGKLVFAGVRGPIRDMFDIAGFLDAFPVVDVPESSATA
jgi:anti-anti-sigma factor